MKTRSNGSNYSNRLTSNQTDDNDDSKGHRKVYLRGNALQRKNETFFFPSLAGAYSLLDKKNGVRNLSIGQEASLILRDE